MPAFAGMMTLAYRKREAVALALGGLMALFFRDGGSTKRKGPHQNEGGLPTQNSSVGGSVASVSLGRNTSLPIPKATCSTRPPLN